LPAKSDSLTVLPCSSGSANFAVIQQWNKSEVYAKTIAYFASQLARAP
jgi:membrane-bound lytic murein transglycosylase B